MSYKKSEASKYSRQSKLLIKSLSNFEETDENFQICYDHVLSSLLYHNYKENNSHEVLHKISRLHEKYIIQSDLEKAKSFKRITDNLINFYNDKGTEEKENGYRILSLILHLAGTGDSNNSTLKNQTRTETLGNKNECFNWVAYMREDDINCNVSLESDSEALTPYASTEELVTSEDESLEDIPDALLRPPPRDDSGLGISPDSCSGTSQLFHAAAAPENVSSVPAKTERNPATFYPYWVQKYQKLYGCSPYDIKTMNFTKIWNECISRETKLIFHHKKTILHERNIIKEVLWMMSGVKDLFIVDWDGSKFIPNAKIHLCNLTSNTLGVVLNEFCTYATKKAILQNHSEHILNTSADCLTYQAYGESLQEQLQLINVSLSSMDKKLREGNDVFTLMVLQKRMKPIFNQINLLYHIYVEVSSELSNAKENCEKSCKLLQSLWVLLLCQSVQEKSSNSLKTLLRIFLKACKPYFTFIENLIILGCFKDLHSEFIIRKRDVTTADENYWDLSLDIRTLPCDLEETFFMKPFLKDIVGAGKSLEILNEIYSLLKTEPFRLNAEKGDLYFKFIQIVQRSISHKNNWLMVSREIEKIMRRNRTCTEMVVQDDPMLTQHVFPLTSTTAKFFQPDVNPAYKQVIQKPAINLHTLQQELTEKMIETIEASSLKPLTAGVDKALNICMAFAYKPVCKRLVKSFKEDYDIMRHMIVMRKYFLMESGDLMYSFYSEIFLKIFSQEPWRDISFLYSALQNAIFEDKVNCRKLYVYLEDNPNRNSMSHSTQQTLSHLSSFQLSYQVKWPITMMLGKSVQNQYSQIFTFLLQIKCAKYLLDNLHSLSLCKQQKKTRLIKAFLKTTVPREQKMHGMYIIRMRLMFFVNGLHNYIMTRILHSFGIEFHEALEKAETLEDMIAAHKSYLKSLNERCLLDRRISYIKDHIFEVLNLCQVFQQLWLKGVDDVSIEELQNIETKFSKVSHILMCCFTKPLRRGTYLHLESLVSTMLSNSHSLHIFNNEEAS